MNPNFDKAAFEEFTQFIDAFEPHTDELREAFDYAYAAGAASRHAEIIRALDERDAAIGLAESMRADWSFGDKLIHRNEQLQAQLVWKEGLHCADCGSYDIRPEGEALPICPECQQKHSPVQTCYGKAKNRVGMP